LRYNSAIYLKRPEKFGAYLNQDSRYPGQDMNKASPKHKLKVLLLEKKVAEFLQINSKFSLTSVITEVPDL